MLKIVDGSGHAEINPANIIGGAALDHMWLNRNSMGDKMNFKIIKKEIDKWDPINLLPHAPSDEYDIESREILSKFQYDIEQNGMVMYEVFSKAFGTTFTKNVNECINISKKIMKQMIIPSD